MKKEQQPGQANLYLTDDYKRGVISSLISLGKVRHLISTIMQDELDIYVVFKAFL